MNAESDSLQASSRIVDPVSGGVTDDGVAIAVDASPSVGRQLQCAREAKGMSLNEVAERLKLSPRQVGALETDDWSRMQCNAITRGFIRNYARLVEVDAAALMSSLDRVGRSQTKEFAIPESINVKVPRESAVARRDYARVAMGGAVLAVAVLAYLFVPPDILQTTYSAVKERLGSKREVDATGGAETESKATEPVAVSPASPAATDSTPTVQPQSVIVPSGPVTSASDAKPANSSTSDATLKFNFAKAAWVEVKDRSGQIVFSQLSPSGSQREVTGVPPFSVIIGNAGNVTLQYKGKDIDLSKRSKDDVSRLTLE